MKIKTDKDCDLSLIRGQTVAILGYGNQGRAQALNLRDSGVSSIVIGSRGDTPAAARAIKDGFDVLSTAEAVRGLAPGLACKNIGFAANIGSSWRAKRT